MKSKITLILSIINFILTAAFTYTYDSSIIAIHYNVNGDADYWGSKWFILIFSAVPLVLSLIYTIVNYVNKSNKNAQINKRVERKMLTYIILWFILIEWIFILSLNNAQNIIIYVFISVAVLFIALGLELPKLKRNKFIGFKTPWTLKSDLVWAKTHLLSKKCMIVSGIILALFSILSAILKIDILCIVGIIITVLITFILPYMYSYKIYKTVGDKTND